MGRQICAAKGFLRQKVNKLQSPKLRLTQSLLVATLTQNFMQFHCTVMEISSIPNYLVYSIKRLPTPKVNKLQSPKLRLTQSLLVATLTHNFMRFCCTVMEISSIPNYLVYSIKRLPTPKVKKLQSPKLRLTLSLLVATYTQNFMRFRCTVMEKCHQNFPPHSSVYDAVTVPVHLHGTNFAHFLLLTRRCYDADTSAILLLLKRDFA